MLDMLDFQTIADDYYNENWDCELTPAQVYICVWSLLKPGSVTSNAPRLRLQHISDYLEKKGYYAKNGGRPKNIGAPMPSERRPV